jgi:hypothetical protein
MLNSYLVFDVEPKALVEDIHNSIAYFISKSSQYPTHLLIDTRSLRSVPNSILTVEMRFDHKPIKRIMDLKVIELFQSEPYVEVALMHEYEEEE